MEQATLSQISSFTKGTYTTNTLQKTSFLQRFNAWLDTQEEKRLLWLGVAILGGIGTVLPLTLLAVVFFANNDFTLWVIALCANVPVLILNLAAQSPKVTLPVLFLVWALDAIIILYSLAVFFVS